MGLVEKGSLVKEFQQGSGLPLPHWGDFGGEDWKVPLLRDSKVPATAAPYAQSPVGWDGRKPNPVSPGIWRTCCGCPPCTPSLAEQCWHCSEPSTDLCLRAPAGHGNDFQDGFIFELYCPFPSASD